MIEKEKGWEKLKLHRSLGKNKGGGKGGKFCGRAALKKKREEETKIRCPCPDNHAMHIP